MRIGLVAPAFRHDAAEALDVARRAEQRAIDGLFVFDHLWPIGRPDRPALSCFPLLGALAGATSTIAVGPLVARVGLVPDAVLVHELSTVHRIAGDRLVAGLGTGDRFSEAENEALGIPFAPVAERVDAVRAVAAGVGELGVRVWVGGRSAAVRRAAADAGAALNVWGADPTTFGHEAEDFRRRCGDRPSEVTWGGQVLIGATAADAARKLERLGGRDGLVHGSVEQVAAQLGDLAGAGASWAVCAPLDIGTDPEVVDLVAAVRTVLAA